MTQIVRVPLAANTLYVSGTVNGIDKIWTREEGNFWSTTAEKSDDGVYRIALSIIYGDGKTTTDSVTLYYGISLVTDRTQADVDRWRVLRSKGWENMTPEEQEEWMAGLKGSYNATDLNRVQGAVDYVKNRLIDAGYIVETELLTTWMASDIPTDTQMVQYLSNVAVIQSTLVLPSYAPPLPDSMKNLTYTGANNIEKILEIVDHMLTNSLEAVWYSGDVYSGEVM